MTQHLHSEFTHGCYRCDISRDEALASITQERDEYEAALRSIYNVLGPRGGNCKVSKCEGCLYEMSEAVDLAREALGMAEGEYPA